MRRASIAVLSLLSLAILAGCLSSTSPEEAPAPMAGYTAPADPIPEEGEGGHDHRDPAQHRFASNATLVSWDDLRRFGWSPETVVGAHAVDIAAARGLLAVGVNAGETADGQQGFHLFDIADAGHLAHLAYYQSPQPVGGDRTIAFSQDGRTVFLGYEGKSVRPGVAAIDVSDPTDPHEVAFWADPQGYGSHTVSTGTIGGAQYVFSLAVGVNILRFDPSQGGRDAGFTFVGKYLTADQLAILDAAGIAIGDQGPGAAQTYAFRAAYGHDMTFFDDPVTHKPLLFVAYAYEGLKVLDMTEPTAPVLVARWMPPADSSEKAYTHSVAAERMPDRKSVV